ncbi:MAG: LysM peptidoglycan-binding domain-containing protein [Chloroflexota bacterium]|jgi:LysM repeat protein|nr:MAG: LysM peptidoglycan-binding domain-containing protein [Chloroflexota bacterium]
MTTMRYIIFIGMVTSALLLAGCTLSASTPPPVTETPDSAMSTLEAELAIIATQTAVAGGGAETAPTQPPETEPTSANPTEAAPETSPETTEAPPPPPSPTPAPVSTATPGIPQTYQLQKGEFPFCIARRFNVNQTELLNLNGLGSGSVLPVGYSLKIPQTGNTFFGQRSLIEHPASYTVVAGDTIYTIACKYGSADPNAIIEANNLKSPYTLSAGQVLQIP